MPFRIIARAVLMIMVLPAGTVAQSVPGAMPPVYGAVLDVLGYSGDYKDDVFKVNLPRTDLSVTVKGEPVPTALGFGGWIAMSRGTEGDTVLMGDLVLTEDEINPVMSALLEQGLEVSAIHNHFFWESPRIFYMHVHGMGTPAALATRLKPALSLIGKGGGTASRPPAETPVPVGAIDGKAIAAIVGHQGEQSGPVYKVTVGRPDIDLREHGAAINARMGLNTWAAFSGTEQDAMVAGDVAMLAAEVTPVLKALRAHGIDVVALHHHMVGTEPTVYFLHYWGQGPAAKLAQAFRAALDQTGRR